MAPQLLGVTDVKTGTTTPLDLFGDNAVWLPNGQYIAYWDWGASVVLNMVSPKGGTPVTVREWASDPSWSNNSRRVAFSDWFNSYVGTVGLDGTEARFDFDTLGSFDGYGCNPAYAPDGKLVVYQRYESYFGVPGPLLAIPVNEKGQALGAPYAITDGTFAESHPSFSNNGKTIVFLGCGLLQQRPPSRPLRTGGMKIRGTRGERRHVPPSVAWIDRRSDPGAVPGSLAFGGAGCTRRRGGQPCFPSGPVCFPRDILSRRDETARRA